MVKQKTPYPSLDIDPGDYDYHLPPESIAQYPLQDRSASNLLICQNSGIHHSKFQHIDQWLPENSLLVFNDTKVIQARLLFQKPTGAQIELFCLEPVDPGPGIHRVMQSQSPLEWYCLVGNKKKWPKEQPLVLEKETTNGPVKLEARFIDETTGTPRIRFHWEPGTWQFSEILELFGRMPLPPYIKRESEAMDQIAYQTVYAHSQGAVAAPTAGLHFTDAVLEKLRSRNIQWDYVTLHVSAGTFQPVQTASVAEHPMHREQIIFSKTFIKRLLSHQAPIIPVGTTSLRALESLYWYGAMVQEQGFDTPFHIEKLTPYRKSEEALPKPHEALKVLLSMMENKGLEELRGATELLIVPGYSFKLTHGLVTNFHQPKSTLLLLVAALVGEEWRTIYKEAVEQGYRFLSYGDASLLLP